MAGTYKPYPEAKEANYTLISGRTCGNWKTLFDALPYVSDWDAGNFTLENGHIEFEVLNACYIWCLAQARAEYNQNLTLLKLDGSSYIHIGYVSRHNRNDVWYKNDFVLSPGRYKAVWTGGGGRIDTEWFFEKVDLYKYLVEEDLSVKYWNGTSFTSLGYPSTKEMFIDHGHSNLDDIFNNINSLSKNIKILTFDPGASTSKKINTISIPKSCILFSDLISFQDSENIDSITIVGSSTNNSKIKILLSPNKKDYYYLKNNNWQLCNFSKENMILNGMTITEFNSIGSSINSFPFDLNKKLSVAFYMELDSLNDTLNLDNLYYQIDLKGSWWDLKDSEFDYGLVSNNSLQIKLLKPGTYKINY